MVAHVNFSPPYASKEYNFQQSEPDYLIVSQLARWKGLSQEELLENHCCHIVMMRENEPFEVIAR